MPVFFPQELTEEDKQLFCYVNQSNKIVIVHLANIPGRYCERVVFPWQKFLFEAPNNSQLEIHQYTVNGLIKDIIPCSQLILENQV